MKLTISISAGRVALILALISLYLCIQSFAGKVIEYRLDTHSTYWIYKAVQLFNVNQEANIPTWYSALMLAISALLIGVIAYAKKVNHDSYVVHWAGLSLIFLYLSVDEAAAIHEIFTIPIQESLNPSGYLYFGWVIVGALFVLVVALAYLRFYFHLPSSTRRLMLLAAVLYVGGALFIEAISANLWYATDDTSLGFSFIGTIEEFFEMMGVTVLIYTLLHYMGMYIREVHLITPRTAITASAGEDTTVQ